MVENKHSWPKRISVDKRIVSLLSRSTYERFPMALRETISNAYDADASIVDVTIDQIKREIIIRDNGIGMTPEEFDFYLRIAGHKRGKTESVKFGRKRIGQLGVGFLSVFPFCNRLEITSTAENSDIVFTARIPSTRFMDDNSSIEDVSQVPVEGFEEIDPKERNQHYTILKLKEISPLVDEYINPSLQKYKKSRYDISSWDGMDRLKWELQETLPIDFPDKSILKEALGQKPVGLEVRLNGEKLYRNDSKGTILDNNDGEVLQIGDIEFKYAISTNWEPVHPYNARGLKVRLKNVGIGERTYFDLGIRGRTWSRLHWLTGEIHIIEGLDESISLDRDSFTWSNSFEEFRDFFRSKLSDIAFEIEDVASSEKKIENIIHSPIGPVKELVEEYLDRLPEDYRIVREIKGDDSDDEPVVFDKEKKEVRIVEDHRIFDNYLQIGSEKLKVKYTSWDYEDERYPVCRLSKRGIIEINMDHPILTRSRNTEVMIKTNIIILLAKNYTKNRSDMYNYIIEKMTEEFS